MPDDKMKNQQGGQKGREDQGQGQHLPGRNPQDDQSTGQRSGGGNNPMHDDEDRGGSHGGQKGSQGQGGMGQKR